MQNSNLITVGQNIPGLSFGPIDRAPLALYAGASADHNPVHIDSDLAQKAGFEDVFAHGLLSTAQFGRLISNWVGPERLVNLETRFIALTQIGDTITFTGEVTELFHKNGVEYAQVALAAFRQNGERTLDGKALIGPPSTS